MTMSGAAGSGRVTVTIVPKPWGHETIWAHTDRYVGRGSTSTPDTRSPFSITIARTRPSDLLAGGMIYRVRSAEGDALVDVRLRPGESYRNVPGTVHQMEAVTDCDMLEASTPDLDDVVRLSDRYGRQGTSAP